MAPTRRPLRRVSVRARLATASALASAVVLLLAGVVLLQVFDRRLDGDVVGALDARLDAAAAAVSTGGASAALTAADRDTVSSQAGARLQVLSSTGDVLTAAPADTPALLTPRDAVRAATAPLTLTREADPPSVVVARPVTTPGGDRAVVAVGASLEPNRQAVTQARSLLLLAWVPASALAGLAGWLLAGAALRPVERLRRTAADIRIRDAAVGLPVPLTGDEIERLARTLDQLVRRLHTALRDRQDRTAELAHELRTPLTALRGELEILDLRRDPDAPVDDGAEGLRAARAAADRLAEQIERLLWVGTADRGADLLHLQVIEPVRLVTDAAERHRADAARAGVDLQVSTPDADPADPRAGLPPVVCDPVRLGQMLDNLVRNALAAVPAGGRIDLAVTGTGDRWQVSVADSGPGFAATVDGDAEQWFARYRSGPSAAGAAPSDGTAPLGLGLAIVRELARAHDGDATAANLAGGGAVVVVDLPVTGPRDALVRDDPRSPTTGLTPPGSPEPAPGRGSGRRRSRRGSRR